MRRFAKRALSVRLWMAAGEVRMDAFLVKCLLQISQVPALHACSNSANSVGVLAPKVQVRVNVTRV